MTSHQCPASFPLVHRILKGLQQCRPFAFQHNVGFGAGMFPVFNRNKRSIAVDVKSAAGKTVLLRLMSQADVLIEALRAT